MLQIAHILKCLRILTPWKLLNWITLGQKQTNSNNQLIIINKQMSFKIQKVNKINLGLVNLDQFDPIN
jgi:hypothetical protein